MSQGRKIGDYNTKQCREAEQTKGHYRKEVINAQQIFSENYRTSQVNWHIDWVQYCKGSHMIHQVINKRIKSNCFQITIQAWKVSQ